MINHPYKYCKNTLVFLLFIFLTTRVNAQNNALILNGGYTVINGGTVANPAYLVINQPNTLGIIRPGGGHINSENQYNFVTWVSGTNTGSYIFPFGVGGNAADYIPFTFNKTAGNSSISMSTWSTDVPNFPRPAATNVGPVTNMSGITDSVVYAIDRFWDIQAPTTTADLTFSYRGIENTTTNPTTNVQAQHWNGATWDAPVGPGTLGVTSGIGIAGPFTGQNTFSPWVLIVPCTADTITQNPVICQGDSVVVGTNVYTVSGTFIDTLTNMLGCDSIVTTNLTVNTPASGTDIQTACNSLAWIDGITYTASTNTPTFTIVGGSYLGCDSVVTLNLTINTFASGTDTQTACNNYTWIDGNNYTTSNNTATFTIVGGSFQGCDSIVTLNLTLNTTTTSTDTQTACNSYIWIDGNTYTSSNNIATVTLTNSLGCDSIITLNLTINTTSTSTDTQTACNSYTWIDGITYTVSTNTPTDTLVAANGCDSIVTLNLTINPQLSATPNAVAPVFCIGDPINLTATSSGNGTITWYSDAAGNNPVGTGSPFSPTINLAGNYTFYVNEVGACSSGLLPINVVVNGVIASIGATPSSGFTPLNVVFTNGSSTGPTITYTWNFGDGTATSNAFEPSYTYTDLGIYTASLTVTDGGLCPRTVTIFIEVKGQSSILIPNVFTPNSDNQNDIFTVEGTNLESVEAEIFNRWGQKMYSWNDVKGYWDGRTTSGTEVPDGTYFYIIKAKGLDGVEYFKKGAFSLIR